MKIKVSEIDWDFHKDDLPTEVVIEVEDRYYRNWVKDIFVSSSLELELIRAIKEMVGITPGFFRYEDFVEEVA